MTGCWQPPIQCPYASAQTLPFHLLVTQQTDALTVSFRDGRIDLAELRALLETTCSDSVESHLIQVTRNRVYMYEVDHCTDFRLCSACGITPSSLLVWGEHGFLCILVRREAAFWPILIHAAALGAKRIKFQHIQLGPRSSIHCNKQPLLVHGKS